MFYRKCFIAFIIGFILSIALFWYGGVNFLERGEGPFTAVILALVGGCAAAGAVGNTIKVD